MYTHTHVYIYIYIFFKDVFFGIVSCYFGLVLVFFVFVLLIGEIKTISVQSLSRV